VKLVPDLLDIKNCVVIHTWVRDLEQGLVLVRVELFVQRIDLFEPVTLENLEQLTLCQLESLEHILVHGIGVAAAGTNRPVENVGDIKQIIEL